MVLGIWPTLAILAVLIAACSPASAPPQAPGGLLQQDAPPTPELEAVEVDLRRMPPMDRERLTAQGCPNIDSRLGQIVYSSNPLETARQLGVRVEGNRIHVLMVLESEQVDFMKAFDVEIGKQSGTEVQAFVPLSSVCELAATDNVLTIRLPNQAIIQ